MKISELERNVITKSEAHLWPYKREQFKGELPITIDTFDVLYRNHSQESYKGIVVGVFDGETPVANLFVTPKEYQGIKCYSVEYAAISPKYQGQNIGYELYRGLIVLVGLPFITTGSQSKGARKLWLKLAQDPQIKAYGFSTDKVGEKIFDLQPNKSQTELKSLGAKVMVYDNWSTGLILVIKNGPYDRKLNKLKQASEKQTGFYNPIDLKKMKKMKKEPKPDIFGVKSFKPIKAT
jgi:hypothetical protein